MVAQHALFVAACAALFAAGWRVAGRAGALGLERTVGATVLACAAAGISSLALGLLGLGGSAVALSATALALAALAERRSVRPMGRSPRRSAWLGWVAGGVGVAWVAWLSRHPVLGTDPLTYHLPEALLWAQGGHPGRGLEVVYEFPIQNYPLTAELLVSWGLSVGGSFGPAMLLTPLSAALFAVAGWAGMQRLGVKPIAAALALLAVLALPLTARQFHGPNTDLPALAFLTATWTLALASRRNTPMLALAIVAAGLAIGTKTTTGPFVVAILAVAAYRSRHALRPRARPLLAALAAATAVGGVWYLRNLIDHGSPFWPFVATPWGDPLPGYLEAIDTSFIERPLDTLRGRETIYTDALAGALLLIPAALLATISAGRRVRIGAAAVAVGALLWTLAPFTGLTDDPVIDLSISTPRYLLPTIAAAALTVALRGWTWVLAGAALWSLERTLSMSYPGGPSLALLLAGAAAGAVAWRLPRPRAAAPVAAAAAAVLLLTALGRDLPRRQLTPGVESRGVTTWLEDRAGDSDLHFAPGILGTAAGERLQRTIHLIPRDEPCDAVKAREGFVVIAVLPNPERRTRFTALDCLQDERPAYQERFWRVYDRRQSARTSRQPSRSSRRSSKSSGVIAAARGSSSRRARVSSRS